MKFTLSTSLFALSALSSFVVSAPIEARDVYVPRILYPTAGTVWKAGSTHKVTWYVILKRFGLSKLIDCRDTSNPPAQITNPLGKIVLAKGDRLIGLGAPLAYHLSPHSLTSNNS
jgi:hypothetical protein